MERRLDGLGRIVVPMEFRNVLGWMPGTRVNINLSGDKIVVTKSEACCSLCGSIGELKLVKKFRMCKKCIDEIKSQVAFEDVDLDNDGGNHGVK